MRRGEQDLVARVVPVGVVDRLEAVEVEEEHAELPHAPAPGERRLEAPGEQPAVRQARQWVVGRLVGDELLGRLASGDVDVRDDGAWYRSGEPGDPQEEPATDRR